MGMTRNVFGLVATGVAALSLLVGPSLASAARPAAPPVYAPALKSPARAQMSATPRVLVLRDFSDSIEASDISNTDDGTVAGVVYHHTIGLNITGSYVALNTAKFRGYTALSFKVGIQDTAAADTVSTLVVILDGLTSRHITMSRGQHARTVVVPFAGHKTITLETDPKGPHSVYSLAIADPTLQ